MGSVTLGEEGQCSLKITTKTMLNEPPDALSLVSGMGRLSILRRAAHRTDVILDDDVVELLHKLVSTRKMRLVVWASVSRRAHLQDIDDEDDVPSTILTAHFRLIEGNDPIKNSTAILHRVLMVKIQEWLYNDYNWKDTRPQAEEQKDFHIRGTLMAYDDNTLTFQFWWYDSRTPHATQEDPDLPLRAGLTRMLDQVQMLLEQMKQPNYHHPLMRDLFLANVQRYRREHAEPAPASSSSTVPQTLAVEYREAYAYDFEVAKQNDFLRTLLSKIDTDDVNKTRPADEGEPSSAARSSKTRRTAAIIMADLTRAYNSGGIEAVYAASEKHGIVVQADSTSR